MVCQQLGPGKLRAGAAGKQEWHTGCPRARLFGGPPHTGLQGWGPAPGLSHKRAEGEPHCQRAAPTVRPQPSSLYFLDDALPLML